MAAAMDEARRRGYERMTLRTYADVPWNAPFYARVGFVETEPTTDFHNLLVDVEERLGFAQLGRRVQMTAALGWSAERPRMDPRRALPKHQRPLSGPHLVHT